MIPRRVPGDRELLTDGGRTMKPVYLGGVRGYQAAVYRPGSGWTVADNRGHAHHQPAVLRKSQTPRVCQLAVARRHRPGLITRTAIVAVMAALVGFLTLVLSGVAQL
jgi:hypothetical protein